MRRNHISPVVLAAALDACAFESELLNSERIEQRFGGYGVDVLCQASGIRRSNLYSVDDGKRICRTYAVVQFVDQDLSELADAHQAVLSGHSIGATFKTTGWQIKKATVHVGNVDICGPQHAIGKLMRLETVENLAMHAYRLILDKNSQSIHYATIVETHHPAYLTEPELLDLYGSELESRLAAGDIQDLVGLISNPG
jgi:hypothetical protein